MLRFRHLPPWLPTFAQIGGVVIALMFEFAAAAQAQHACDALGDEGWRTVATQEVTGVKDGKPFAVGGDWFVERTTTLLPLCNYVNAVGNYSLRSYSLDPIEKKERVAICRGGVAVAPYPGACPPR